MLSCSMVVDISCAGHAGLHQSRYHEQHPAYTAACDVQHHDNAGRHNAASSVITGADKSLSSLWHAWKHCWQARIIAIVCIKYICSTIYPARSAGPAVLKHSCIQNTAGLLRYSRSEHLNILPHQLNSSPALRSRFSPVPSAK